MKIKMSDKKLEQLISDITNKNVFAFDGCFCGHLQYPIGSIDERKVYLCLDVYCRKSGGCGQNYYQLQEFDYSIELKGEEKSKIQKLLEEVDEVDYEKEEEKYDELWNGLEQYIEHEKGDTISKILTDDIHLSKKQEKRIREAVYNRYCRNCYWSEEEKDFPLNTDPDFKI